MDHILRKQTFSRPIFSHALLNTFLFLTSHELLGILLRLFVLPLVFPCAPRPRRTRWHPVLHTPPMCVLVAKFRLEPHCRRDVSCAKKHRAPAVPLHQASPGQQLEMDARTGGLKNTACTDTAGKHKQPQTQKHGHLSWAGYVGIWWCEDVVMWWRAAFFTFTSSIARSLDIYRHLNFFDHSLTRVANVKHSGWPSTSPKDLGKTCPRYWGIASQEPRQRK